MSETNFRALCEELTNELQGYKVASPMHCRTLVDRARALLAQPEPVAPTDEELLELMPEEMRDDLAELSCIAAQHHGLKPGIFRVVLNTNVMAYARAVLARWGTPANNTGDHH